MAYVDGTVLPPPRDDPKFEVWDQQDQSTHSLIISSISDETMYLAIGQTTFRGI